MAPVSALMFHPSKAYRSTNAQESSPHPPCPQLVPQEFSIHTPAESYLGANTAWLPRDVVPGDGTSTKGWVGLAASKLGYTGIMRTTGFPAAREASTADWLALFSPLKSSVSEATL